MVKDGFQNEKLQRWLRQLCALVVHRVSLVDVVAVVCCLYCIVLLNDLRPLSSWMTRSPSYNALFTHRSPTPTSRNHYLSLFRFQSVFHMTCVVRNTDWKRKLVVHANYKMYTQLSKSSVHSPSNVHHHAQNTVLFRIFSHSNSKLDTLRLLHVVASVEPNFRVFP